MNLSENPVIQALADTDSDLLRFFSPVEIAVIETCKEICKEHGKNV